MMSASLKNRASPTKDDCDMDDEKEVVDEEEALFIALEKRKAAEEAIEPHTLPNDVKSAPKLLQDALKLGSIEDPSSPSISKPDAKVEDNAAQNSTVKTDENEEKKNEEIEPEPTAVLLQKVSWRFLFWRSFLRKLNYSKTKSDRKILTLALLLRNRNYF
jgi:hypothetical protein